MSKHMTENMSTFTGKGCGVGSVGFLELSRATTLSKRKQVADVPLENLWREFTLCHM